MINITYKISDSIEEIDEIEEIEEIEENARIDKNLDDEWLFYSHFKSDQNNYDKNTFIMGKCRTLFEFGMCFNTLPGPKILFYQPTIGKSHVNHDGSLKEIVALSLFKKGIEPKWEDPHNKNGGHIELRRSQKPIDKISNIDYITNLYKIILFKCIGSQFVNYKYINGFRIVDSSIPIKGSNSYSQLYRIELWYSSFDKSDEILKEFRSIYAFNKLDTITCKKH